MNKVVDFLVKNKFYILFFLALIVLLIPHISLLNDFKQLPSPIYGGDYYHQQGAVEYMGQGGSPFTSFATINDTIPSYFPLYTLIPGFMSMLGLTAMSAMFIFSIVIFILAFYSFFLLANFIIKNKYASLLVSIFACRLIWFPALKYSVFTRVTVFVLFFYFFFKFLRKKDLKNSLLAGLFYGFCGLGHGSAFISVSLVIFFGFFWFNRAIYKIKFKEYFYKNWKANVNYVIMFLVGFGISLIYWGNMFANFGNFPNQLTEWCQLNYELAVVQSNLFKAVVSSLFTFTNVWGIIFGLLVIAFILLMIFVSGNKYFQISKKRILFFSVILLLLSFHFYLTLPLLGTEFSPGRMWGFVYYILIIFITSFVFKSFLTFGFIKKYKKEIFSVLFILFILISLIGFNSYVKNDKWIPNGFAEQNPLLLESKAAILKYTALDDNFISSKEVGFAINSLTGRRFLSIRRNQHPLTSEVDQRELDLAIILYGNSSDKRAELLKQYDIDYLYWDYFWMQSEFRFDDTGKLVNLFDPILIIRTPEREALLKKYNISYSNENMVVDSSKRDRNDIKKFDVLLVYPNNWSNEPWHPDLNNFLEEVWVLQEGGTKYARLLKINVESDTNNYFFS